MEENPVFLVGKEYYTICHNHIRQSPSPALVAAPLEEIARYIRINTLSTIYNAKHGWLGACLSCTDLLTCLYFNVMNRDDLLILSKGHAAVALHIQDGNNMGQVLSALDDMKQAGKPVVIVADTEKGAGISFMSSKNCGRRRYQWHGGIPSPEEYYASLQELSCELRNRELASRRTSDCTAPRS